MTDQEIADLGPAFSRHLQGYRDCLLQKRTAAHFDNYCRVHRRLHPGGMAEQNNEPIMGLGTTRHSG